MGAGGVYCFSRRTFLKQASARKWRVNWESEHGLTSTVWGSQSGCLSFKCWCRRTGENVSGVERLGFWQKNFLLKFLFYVYMCRWAHPCMPACRPRWCYVSLFTGSRFIFWDRVISHWTWSLKIGQRAPRTHQFLPSSTGMHPAPNFYVGARGLNSGPLDCTLYSPSHLPSAWFPFTKHGFLRPGRRSVDEGACCPCLATWAWSLGPL